MESFRKYIKQFPNYKPSAFEAVLPFLTTKQLAAGEYLLKEGSVCRSIAYIEKGLLRLYYLNNGKEVTNCFCREHTLTASYRSMVTMTASDISIQTLEHSQLIMLSYEALQKLFVTDSFWQQVGRVAIESEYLINEKHSRFLRDKSAQERYLEILNSQPDLLQRVPLTALASYLQVSPETLSRIRKKISTT